MANDLKNPYTYPFEAPAEDAVAMPAGADSTRPAGIPSSYE